MRIWWCGILLFAGFLFLCSTDRVHAVTEKGRASTQVWSGYWWPTARGEILGPLSKYDRLTGSGSAAWEERNHPPGADVPSWYGLCHAWAASAVMESEPKRPVRAGSEHLSTGDQKGLLAVCHSDDVSNFYGDRFGDGIGSEEPQDILPDELWMVLRRYIREQKLPIVLDLEPGPQVWNYPAFAYRIDYHPVRAGSPEHHCELHLWLVDDGVPIDFVGTRQVYQRYQFRVEITDGSVVLGTGKWVGESERKHPDFAWFPYVVRSSNPEMDYGKVCDLLGRSPVTGDDPDSTPDDEVVPPDSGDPDSSGDPDNGVRPDGGDPDSDTDSVSGLTISELFRLLEDQKSDFVLDASADHFNGVYTEGDRLVIRGISRESGYLYLFCTGPEGILSVLYPQPEDSPRVTANEEFVLPPETSSYEWLCSPPYGTSRIHVLVTEKPLFFTGGFRAGSPEKDHPETKSSLPLNALQVRLIPSDQEELEAFRSDSVKGGGVASSDRLRSLTGRFAQDEVVLYIGGSRSQEK
ncbi:MAG: DUF4384 domain-containing protein [Planctomycetia bacterium]|nr:DUF4384 domain-containing protein [Planctomycetia bacterium]